ncbi:MAG: 16S rRNA (cytosine(967)-C(5))-methyltransferase RsmB [Deltaproteobacteria bacterium]|nr:16S rRNA (cytosine(967)-C(5))-methyltransferase RsmB [Deltaproteobacteria bacterium]
MDTVRSLAVEILNRIEVKGAFAEPLLDEVLSGNRLNNILDRKLLTQIVYGTLRLRGRIDWIIALFYRGRLDDLDTDVKNVLRMSVYQLFFTQRLPHFAVCDEAVKIAKRLNPKTSGLVNAVLRNAIRRTGEIAYPDGKESPALFISVFHSHPLWLVEKWIRLFGFEHTAMLCHANNEVPPAAVRVNRIKITREAVVRELGEEKIEAVPASYSPDGLILTTPSKPIRETRSYQNGHVQMQDEASQMIARLADPRRGDRILDLCAGTGGKTTHLAAIMGNEGHITAIDVSRQKLAALKKNAERLGVSIIHTLPGDAAGSLKIDTQQKFDKILIDAPCSGLGSLRRNPEIKWRLTPQDIDKSAALQRCLIRNAVHYIKDGGRLIYSTCTNLPEENEDIIEDFLETHGGFHRLPLPETIPGNFRDERGHFKTKTHLCGLDGFFGAILGC